MNEVIGNEPDFVRDFRSAYYGPSENFPDGQIALGRRAVSMAGILAPAYWPNHDIASIQGYILQSLVRATYPDPLENYEPLKEPGVELIAAVRELNIPVYIWTVGDMGRPFKDPDRDIIDPIYDYQEMKIRNSGLLDRFIDRIDDQNEDIHKDTRANTKESSLRTILTTAIAQGVDEVYIADDLTNNEELVRNLATEYPELTINFWLIKPNEDDAGNMAAYRDFLIPVLRSKTEIGSKAFVVLDLDDTLFETQLSLEYAAHLVWAKLIIAPAK